MKLLAFFSNLSDLVFSGIRELNVVHLIDLKSFSDIELPAQVLLKGRFILQTIVFFVAHCLKVGAIPLFFEFFINFREGELFLSRNCLSFRTNGGTVARRIAISHGWELIGYFKMVRHLFDVTALNL